MTPAEKCKRAGDGKIKNLIDMQKTLLELFDDIRRLNVDDYSGIVTGQLFVVLNLERMTGNRPVFWKADGHGYTNNILLAGIYDRAGLKKQCIYADDPVVPISKLPELLQCNMEVLKQFYADADKKK